MFYILDNNVDGYVFQYLLKNDPRTFDDKQFQIYLFGSFISGAMAMLQSPITADSLTPIMTMKGIVNAL